MIPHALATLAIAGAGLCLLVPPLRRFAWRLVVVGGLIAIGAGLIR